MSLFSQEKFQFGLKIMCYLKRQTSYSKKANQTSYFRMLKDGMLQAGKSD